MSHVPTTDDAAAGDRPATLCGWLMQRQAEATAADAACVEASWVCAYLRSGDAAELRGRVVRDVRFVKMTTEHELTARRVESEEETRVARAAERPDVFCHAVLDHVLCPVAEEEEENTTTDECDVGTAAMVRLRYAAVAHSLHPVTVFQLLDVTSTHTTTLPPCTESDVEGVVLAVASVLAQKSALRAGGLQRAAHFRASAAWYMTRRLPTYMARLRYTALLCRTACGALATGALGAACLLCAVADAAVVHVFVEHTTPSQHAEGMDEAVRVRLESDVVESIDFVRSFAQWALQSAAISLGVMSAHVGAPNTATKEASLRDGKAHRITTSRTVEIEPLRITRPTVAPPSQ